jgi:hypothetical protein
MKKKKSVTPKETLPKTPKVKKEKPFYVSPKIFEDEIRIYYNTGKISENLGKSVIKIAHGLSYAPNFINYTYKDEMVGDAIVKMFSALRNQKFRLDSGFSPFSYFTTIAFHAFINRIKKEKKHTEALNDYKEKVYTDLMHSDPEGHKIYIKPGNSEDTDDNDIFTNLNG